MPNGIESVFNKAKPTAEDFFENLNKQLDHAQAVGEVATRIANKQHGPTVKSVHLKSGDQIPTELLTKKPIAITCTPDEIVLWYIDDGNIKRVH